MAAPLAPAAVAAVVGAVVDPLIDVRQVLTICGLGTNVDRFVTCHSLTSMDDFEYMNHDETHHVVKMYNERCRDARHKLGFPVQKKLKGLLYWYQDKVRRQTLIEAADFTLDVMRDAIRQCAVDESEKDSDKVEIKIGKIDTDLGWWTFKEKLSTKLENMSGLEGTPLVYIIAPAKPAGWTILDAVNDLERLIYSVSLTGIVFDKDNAKVWAVIQGATMDTSSYEWIRQYDLRKDGRGAVQALTLMCEGAGANNKRILLSTRIISLDQNQGGAFFQDEYMYSFEKYITALQQAFTTIERYRNATAPETMVQRMIDGIRVQNSLVLTMAKEHVINTFMGDWLGAVSHMSMKVASHFPPRAAGKRKGGDHRKVSAADRKGGRGRGRRNNDRGGQGGRGGRNGGARGNDQRWFNGVDTSDPTVTFTDKEMNQMGLEGRRSVYERRNPNGYQGGRGNGGRGGYDRGRGDGYGRGGRNDHGDFGRGHGGDRQIQQAGRADQNQANDPQPDGTMVPYNGGQPTNEQFRAAQGRGGQAGGGFGRGAYGRGGRGGGRF